MFVDMGKTMEKYESEERRKAKAFDWIWEHRILDLVKTADEGGRVRYELWDDIDGGRVVSEGPTPLEAVEAAMREWEGRGR